MATRLLSLRLKTDTLDRLQARARETGEPKSSLAQRLIDEGLRMEVHPGIVFKDGPTGRRAAVAHGPDVWEIIPAVRNVEATDEQAIENAAEWLGLTKHQVYAAVRYYAEYTEEVDCRIQRNDERAERLEAEWLREQRLLAR